MRTRARIMIAGLVLGTALVGSVAWATIPDAAGVINGCYRTSLDDQKGQLRIVDDPASCRSNESAIQWNQEGPTGDSGAQGLQGIQGATGATGAQGPQGDKGDTGAEGPRGDPGAAGTNGTDGVNGTDGAAGVAGTNGTDGVSVTSQVLSVGDANCSSGGSKFTAAGGTTYACNGVPASASGSGLVAVQGLIKIVNGATHIDVSSRGVVSVDNSQHNGGVTVYWSADCCPSPCPAGKTPLVVATPYNMVGVVVLSSLGENGFMVHMYDMNGVLKIDSGQFTFYAVC